MPDLLGKDHSRALQRAGTWCGLGLYGSQGGQLLGMRDNERLTSLILLWIFSSSVRDQGAAILS
jgi:hypothetical protein